MESDIKKIICIDKEIEKYKKDTDIIIKNKKENLKKYLSDLDLKFKKEVTIKKKEIMDKKINKAYVQLDKIKKDKELEIKEINEIYIKIKDDLIKESLLYMIRRNKEG